MGYSLSVSSILCAIGFPMSPVAAATATVWPLWPPGAFQIDVIRTGHDDDKMEIKPTGKVCLSGGSYIFRRLVEAPAGIGKAAQSPADRSFSPGLRA